MEVSNEAKRIMVVALGKLYSSRTQRGGLRLHRSLLLTLVMKSARDMYHAAQTTAESTEQQQHHHLQQQQPTTEVTTETSPREEEVEVVVVVAGSPSENKENQSPESGPAAQLSRKRRGKAAAEPDFLPCKKAKLEQVSRAQPQPLVVNAVLMDYVNCSSGLGAPPAAPMPLQRAIAAC